ncbi:MAG: ferredoxin [Candidatus Leucobacter sulfamidivorax]|nr:ferredoxin [Candidatus Leucobacter sulfamidivorax]
MSFKITVDLGLCQGYAACLIESPALFDIDDDTEKAVVLGGPEHDESMRQQAEAAMRACPARAITIEDA